MPTAVIVYAARYHPRLAYTRPVPTLLKEYLPISRPVAMNELLLLQHLFRGLPDDKYAAVRAPWSRVVYWSQFGLILSYLSKGRGLLISTSVQGLPDNLSKYAAVSGQW